MVGASNLPQRTGWPPLSLTAKTAALSEDYQTRAVGEVCRKIGVSEQTFYRWKRKYVGMGVAELRRIRQLEEENRKLKRIVADLSLDKHMLQEVLSKKV